jgi:hypothetical protein
MPLEPAHANNRRDISFLDALLTDLRQIRTSHASTPPHGQLITLPFEKIAAATHFKGALFIAHATPLRLLHALRHVKHASEFRFHITLLISGFLAVSAYSRLSVSFALRRISDHDASI